MIRSSATNYDDRKRDQLRLVRETGGTRLTACGAPNVNKAADPYSAGQKGPLASAVRLMRRDPLPKGRGRIIADELSSAGPPALLR